MSLVDVIRLANITRSSIETCLLILHRFWGGGGSKKATSSKISKKEDKKVAQGAKCLLNILARPTWCFNTQTTVKFAKMMTDELKKPIMASVKPGRSLAHKVTVTVDLEDYAILHASARDFLNGDTASPKKSATWMQEPNFTPILRRLVYHVTTTSISDSVKTTLTTTATLQESIYEILEGYSTLRADWKEREFSYLEGSLKGLGGNPQSCSSKSEWPIDELLEELKVYVLWSQGRTDHE